MMKENETKLQTHFYTFQVYLKEESYLARLSL